MQIEKKEVKLSLFAKAMIIYTKNPVDSTHIQKKTKNIKQNSQHLLERINKLRKLQDTKIRCASIN